MTVDSSVAYKKRKKKHEMQPVRFQLDSNILFVCFSLLNVFYCEIRQVFWSDFKYIYYSKAYHLLSIS